MYHFLQVGGGIESKIQNCKNLIDVIIKFFLKKARPSFDELGSIELELCSYLLRA
jgi:hypothetical protein